MKVKEHISNLKNSSIVQGAIEKLKPTWNVIKNGGYKIILISSIITMMFMPIKFLISLISKLLLGGASVLGFAGVKDVIESLMNGYSPFSTSLLVMSLIVTVISGIISLISFIVTSFIVSNANFRAFKILAEEDRIISFGEYFKLAFTEIVPFGWKYFLNVVLPIIIINLVGVMINVIPYINGRSIARIVISILTYALIFRFFAIMLKLDHEQVVSDFSAYWLTFAIVIYLVKIVTTLTIIPAVLQIVFTLYTLLLLTGSKHYYGEKTEIEA